MTGRRTTTTRRRRVRGSLNPEDILEGAFELAAQVSLDGLSMPMLGRHLGIGVTSIYWYFHKKDDLLDAMAERALHRYVFETTLEDGGDWRETLRGHACRMRRAFLANPVLCDLLLIRSARSPHLVRVGAQVTEQVITTLVDLGLSLGDACDTFSAVQLHVRGSVVLRRLHDRNQALNGSPGSGHHDSAVIDPATTPLLAAALAGGRGGGMPDDHNFEVGLDYILDHAGRLIAAGSGARRIGAPAPDRDPAPADRIAPTG
ncbi:TetR/AcrR family transcriptional regulator [Nocardia sp. alder85J]|uniref:TetR/AcrR family transcriptional regulator n=1 Tax=Nocardia sp. alder85J TaxID=2862949 RepID=UPI001CD44E64|nr:TetR/AcrR family transcriptional regulator C-terminal domain-containing protein [Nocardia sp. alder85J]MCX4096781.1 TetR/AcrR family transcriptional regulator C-terminal domain-containing protein [Nocardia sp. alder85J]